MLVESPVYPNATEALRNCGARLAASPVDPDGWDLDAVRAALRQTSPRLTYLIPDFQNPTGLLMSDEERETYAAHVRAARTVAVVDEAHQALPLEGQPMPRPFAAYSPGTITIGSASKSFWGGLRLGWVRAPHDLVDRLTHARVSIDLGAPVLEQLVLLRLLEGRDEIARPATASGCGSSATRWWPRSASTSRVGVPGADRRAGAVVPAPRGRSAPRWPPRPSGTASSSAPGPMFAAEGGLDRFVRVPWSKRPAELVVAAERIGAAWTRSRADARLPAPAAAMMVA